MYVCMHLQVNVQGPTRTSAALRHWPPWLEHQGGTAIGWVSPPLPGQQRGDTYPYIYIYMSESLSVCSVAAKHRRLFLSAMLSERWSAPVFTRQPSLALLLVPSTCRAAAASARAALRRHLRIAFSLCPLVCAESTSHIIIVGTQHRT